MSVRDIIMAASGVEPIPPDPLAGTVQLPAAGISIYRVVSSPTGQPALSITFLSAGNWSSANFSGGASILNPFGTWLLSGTAANYQIRWFTTRSEISGSPKDTWNSLGSNVTWSYQATGGYVTAVGTLQIRNSSTLAVLASCNLSIFAENGWA